LGDKFDWSYKPHLYSTLKEGGTLVQHTHAATTKISSNLEKPCKKKTRPKPNREYLGLLCFVLCVLLSHLNNHNPPRPKEEKWE